MLAGGLITFAIRLSFIYLWGRVDVPPRMRSALRFVPAAVLSAIVLPELVMPTGTLNLSLHNFRLLAGCLAILVAWRTKNVLVTIIVGMALLLWLQAAF
jgi:branched-subunit amino acid transport protein